MMIRVLRIIISGWLLIFKGGNTREVKPMVTYFYNIHCKKHDDYE